MLPSLLEIKLLCVLATMAIESGNEPDHRRLLEIAMGEAAGNATIQERIATALTSCTGVDHLAILTLNKNFAPESGGPEAAPAA